jgi:VWFA-related protein
MKTKERGISEGMSGRERLGGLLALILFLAGVVPTRGGAVPRLQTSTGTHDQPPQVTVPARPTAPLYKGDQGTQRSEIKFAPATRRVTIKLHVEDPNGYFLPNIRRENFAVYEDGVRQKDVSVDIEHSHVSVALLMEGGSRYHEINKLLGDDVPRLGRELLAVLTPDDKTAVFKYDSKLQTVADFGQSPSELDRVFIHYSAPGISEANFYDALLETMARMKDVPGRRAVIVISSGVDTFSKASFQDVLRAAEASAVPIYTIGLGHIMKLKGDVVGPSAPFARIDWDGAERQLEQLAKASGGRAYAVDSTLEIPGIYDDIMENLRVRYVISYASSNPATAGPPRKVQVELIDPQTGQALKIHDASGKAVAAKVYLQESFTLEAAPGD